MKGVRNMQEIIKCRFNLFDEGREYTGHHRKYVLENARRVCYAPGTREGLRLREKLGYLGHGRREMAGKVRIDEVEKVKMPDGSMTVVENVPSNVTTFFEIDKKGNVDHHQEIIGTNQPGKIVSGLNQSKVGGFSWAMGGRDGGAHGATRVSSFEGFDYVMNPGFSANRGYVLESAGSKDMILESICKTGIDEMLAGKYLEDWAASAQVYAVALEERLENAEIFESALVEKNEALSVEIEALKEQAEVRHAMITECAKNHAVVVPEDVANALISMANKEDFNKLVGFFESAGNVDLSRYPLPGVSREKIVVDAHRVQKVPEYGQAAAAVDFESKTFLIK
jgi:hypothetical protein